MNPLALVWMVLFLVANGFFVAAEFAYITARRNVLEGMPGRSARVAIKLNEELSLSLTAAQLGITIFSLLLGAVAEPAVARMIEPLLALTPLPEGSVHPIAFTIALLFVVFLHMVIGEMAPKNIAISSPEKSAKAMALPFRGFIIALRPLIALLNGAANGLLRLAGVNPATRLDLGHSAGDLAIIISAGREEGVIEDFAHRLLTGAIMFRELDASEVMVPRPDVRSVNAETSVSDVRELMRASGHSRIPIHTGDLDDTLGFLHVKDLIDMEEERLDEPVSRDLIRPLLIVPETARLRAVLNEMRKERNHIALVVDEHGSAAGIITMEDIAEELVGEINDEHDLRTRTVARRRDGSVLAAGGVRLDQLKRLGITLPEGEYETIGGLVMDRLGRVPVRGDSVDAEGWRIRVRSVDGRRVLEVLITSEGVGDDLPS